MSVQSNILLGMKQTINDLIIITSAIGGHFDFICGENTPTAEEFKLIQVALVALRWMKMKFIDQISNENLILSRIGY